MCKISVLGQPQDNVMDEEKFWDNVEEQIREATRATFKALVAKQPDDNIYAFALYTDSGAMTVCPAANSMLEFSNRLACEGEPDDRNSRNYYQWVTSAWAFEGWKSENFRHVSHAISGSEFRADFGKFKRTLFAVMVKALKSIDTEGLFGAPQDRGDAVVFVTVTDDDAENVENMTAQVLNPERVFRRFVCRYD